MSCTFDDVPSAGSGGQDCCVGLQVEYVCAEAVDARRMEKVVEAPVSFMVGRGGQTVSGKYDVLVAD